MEVRQGVVRINLNCFLEIIDGVLVVTHILIHKPTLDVNSLIICEVDLNIGELSQSLMESLCSSIHQTKMEH